MLVPDGIGATEERNRIARAIGRLLRSSAEALQIAAGLQLATQLLLVFLPGSPLGAVFTWIAALTRGLIGA